MKSKGFTLIELVMVILLLAVISVTAVTRFVAIQDDAKKARMQTMLATLKSSQSLIATKIILNPEQLNNNKNRYTLPSGERIRVRGGLADGRWNNTFIHLVDFENTAQINNNNCTDSNLQWCVRHKGQAWFNNRGYANLGTGRGFVIFPFGNNVNRDRCYVYYINQNNSATPTSISPSITGIDLSEC